jgi:hypothetical protein
MATDETVVLNITAVDEFTQELYKNVLNALNAKQIGGIWDGTVWPHCADCNDEDQNDQTLDRTGHTRPCKNCQVIV